MPTAASADRASPTTAPAWRRSAQHGAGTESGGVVKGSREEIDAAVRMAEDVAGGAHEEDGDHHSHTACQAGIHARRSADSLEVQPGKQQGEENRPAPI